MPDNSEILLEMLTRQLGLAKFQVAKRNNAIALEVLNAALKTVEKLKAEGDELNQQPGDSHV